MARYVSNPSASDAGRYLIGLGAKGLGAALDIAQGTARKAIDKLTKLNLLKEVTDGVNAGRAKALHELCHSPEVPFPHALIDGLATADGASIPGIVRIKSGSPELQVRMIALILLYYKHHSLLQYGGVNPDHASYHWAIQSTKALVGGCEVVGNRASPGVVFSEAFVSEFCDLFASGSLSAEDQTLQLSEAADLINTSGLLYEVVTLIDSKRKPLFPLRINSQHAVSNGSERSLVQDLSEKGVVFYARYDNKEGKDEGPWFVMPGVHIPANYGITGTLRMRFRCATSDTAEGLLRDAKHLDAWTTELTTAELI
jgi:hypothetical protein